MPPNGQPVSARLTPEETATVSLGLRGLILKLAVGLALFLGALFTVGYAWRAELLAVSRWFVEWLGGPGVAVGFMVPDALTLPIPQDAFLAFALVGGLPFWTIVAWGTLGSLVGGSLGFALGRGLQRTRWYRRMVRRRGMDAERLVRRYGGRAVALGAITPIPYSLMCWSAGALGMKFIPFLGISLLRVVRVAGYLWLIQLGVLHVLG